MDPATMAIGLQLIGEIIQGYQLYQAGTLTNEQVLQYWKDSSARVLAADQAWAGAGGASQPAATTGSDTVHGT